jgi:hypothetical protein
VPIVFLVYGTALTRRTLCGTVSWVARVSRHEKAVIFGDAVPVKGGDRVVRTLGAGGRAVVQDLAVGDGRSRRSPLSTTRLERTEEQQ